MPTPARHINRAYRFNSRQRRSHGTGPDPGDDRSHARHPSLTSTNALKELAKDCAPVPVSSYQGDDKITCTSSSFGTLRSITPQKARKSSVVCWARMSVITLQRQVGEGGHLPQPGVRGAHAACSLFLVGEKEGQGRLGPARRRGQVGIRVKEGGNFEVPPIVLTATGRVNSQFKRFTPKELVGSEILTLEARSAGSCLDWARLCSVWPVALQIPRPLAGGRAPPAARSTAVLTGQRHNL